jgi:hypothetical protein
MEHDVLETIQFIVDTVCSENEVQEASILIMNDSNDEHSSSSLIKPAYEHRLEESNGDSSVAQHSSYE